VSALNLLISAFDPGLGRMLEPGTLFESSWTTVHRNRSTILPVLSWRPDIVLVFRQMHLSSRRQNCFLSH
jgi:hypothetical protein